MRSAYNRTGFSVIALFGAMGVGQNLGAVLGAAFCLLHFFVKEPLVFMTELENFREMMEGTGPVDPLSVRFFVRADLTTWIFAGLMIGALLGTAIGILIMRRITSRHRVTPSVKFTLTFGEFILAVLMAYGLWGTGVIVGNIAGLFGADTGDGGLFEIAGKGIYFYYAYAILCAPVVEELAFRKTLIDATGHFGSVVSAFVTAMLFGLMHGNSTQFLLAFNIGLLFACIYRYTGRIIYTMILHAMINLTATLPALLMIFNIDINAYWNYGLFGLTAIGLLTVLIFRKQPMLSLERPESPNANKETFRNPGMILCVVFGLLLLVGTDLLNLFTNWTALQTNTVFLAVIPLTLAVAEVITLTCTVGRHQKYTDHEESEILQVLI